MDRDGATDVKFHLTLALANWNIQWRRNHPEPASLFHYTDAQGLLGIITSGTLWGSHISYLNDSEEFRYAQVLITKVLQSQVESSLDERRVRLRRLLDVAKEQFLVTNDIAEPYVFCLCEDGNLLSQWRSYADSGTGFAIGLDPRKMMNALGRDSELAPALRLLKVVYEEDEQRNLIASAIDQLVDIFETFGEREAEQCVVWVFAEMLLCFKHRSFREEREWRLVLMYSQPKLVGVRVSHGRLLPYVSMPISGVPGDHPFVSVTHGPTLEAGITQKAVRLLLSKSNIHEDEILVGGSDAPLRSR